MIFITLGSQKFQFDRLLKAVDEQIADGKIKDRVFAQRGASTYTPENYDYTDFLSREEFSKKMDEADIVLTHGGTGAIIGAVKKEKKVIAVPRLSKYEEHVDDHQTQITEMFSGLGFIIECTDCDSLWEAIEDAKKTEPKKYESNTAAIIDSIEEFIKEKK